MEKFFIESSGTARGVAATSLAWDQGTAGANPAALTKFKCCQNDFGKFPARDCGPTVLIFHNLPLTKFLVKFNGKCDRFPIYHAFKMVLGVIAFDSDRLDVLHVFDHGT